MTPLTLLLSLTASVSCLEITGVFQTVQNVEPGGSVRLVCRSSQDWEFCQWSLRYPDDDQISQHCSLEWKLFQVN